MTTTPRILFIASLHHPEALLKEQSDAQQAGQPLPLFPKSSAFRFWANAMRKRGYAVDVFWRNISGFGMGDIRQLKAEKYTERLTPRRLFQAGMRRLPYHLNPDLRRRNARLITTARQFQPTHLWLVGDNRVIHADTLAQLKSELGCKLIYSTGTSPIIFSQMLERAAAPLLDIVLVNDYYHGIQWLELGAKEMICLPVVAIDPDFHYPRPPDPDFVCDVGFVGTLIPPELYSERINALTHLSKFNPGIWSVHDVPATLRPHVRGSALGESMLQVLSSSTISLNVHGNFMRYGGNMRLFEAAAVGTFQIVDNRPGVSEWFTPGEHLVTFSDFQDLQEKVAYYLAHPSERESIARAGYEHVRSHHTYDKRLEQLENVGLF